MAGGVPVPDQPRVGGGKQKQKHLADGANRRALGDIGNLAVAPAAADGKKPQIPTTRPITRSFGVQLLENAQAQAKKNNLKKPLAEKKYQPLKKKEPLKPQKNSEPAIISAKKAREGSSKKKPGKTLTSTLTARSKVACGITKRPKDPILDIDSADVDDELAAVEYIEDIYKFYKDTENDMHVHDYMDSQKELNYKMRAILVDWLIEVHRKFELMPESLYLTVNLVDRFLSVKAVPRRELQLLGISSMLIACKYEEIFAPEVSDFIAISDNAYVREQVLLMEKAILGKLEWYLTVPTPYVFLVRYVKASTPADKEMENMTFFFAELGLTNYSTMINYSASKVAASAVYAARCTLGRKPLWTETLRHHTGYSEDRMMECAKLLGSLHSGVVESKQKAVYRKYSSSERGAVALLPPAGSLVPVEMVKE